MKVTAVELTGEEILDIIERFPRACSYWASNFKVSNSGAYLTEDDNEEKHQITANKVKEGVRLAMTHSSYVAKQIADNDDLGFIDLAAVDMIVQYGLFGKLVYG